MLFQSRAQQTHLITLLFYPSLPAPNNGFFYQCKDRVLSRRVHHRRSSKLFLPFIISIYSLGPISLYRTRSISSFSFESLRNFRLSIHLFCLPPLMAKYVYRGMGKASKISSWLLFPLELFHRRNKLRSQLRSREKLVIQTYQNNHLFAKLKHWLEKEYT